VPRTCLTLDAVDLTSGAKMRVNLAKLAINVDIVSDIFLFGLHELGIPETEIEFESISGSTNEFQQQVGQVNSNIQ
jgi:hypothetical protein